MLAVQTWVVTLWTLTKQRLVELKYDDRGDTYSTTIMIAVGVTIAIAVGAILMVKFTGKADSIDTDTPTYTP